MALPGRSDYGPAHLLRRSNMFPITFQNGSKGSVFFRHGVEEVPSVVGPPREMEFTECFLRVGEPREKNEPIMSAKVRRFSEDRSSRVMARWYAMMKMTRDMSHADRSSVFEAFKAHNGRLPNFGKERKS